MNKIANFPDPAGGEEDSKLMRTAGETVGKRNEKQKRNRTGSVGEWKRRVVYITVHHTTPQLASMREMRHVFRPVYGVHKKQSGCTVVYTKGKKNRT